MHKRSLVIFGNALPNFLGQVRVLEKFRNYTYLIKDVQRRARENAERIRMQKYTMETELFTLIVQKLEKFMHSAKAKDLYAKLQNVNKQNCREITEIYFARKRIVDHLQFMCWYQVVDEPSAYHERYEHDHDKSERCKRYKESILDHERRLAAFDKFLEPPAKDLALIASKPKK